MSGSDENGEDLEAGRTNRATGRTKLIGSPADPDDEVSWNDEPWVLVVDATTIGYEAGISPQGPLVGGVVARGQGATGVHGSGGIGVHGDSDGWADDGGLKSGGTQFPVDLGGAGVVGSAVFDGGAGVLAVGGYGIVAIARAARGEEHHRPAGVFEVHGKAGQIRLSPMIVTGDRFELPVAGGVGDVLIAEFRSANANDADRKLLGVTAWLCVRASDKVINAPAGWCQIPTDPAVRDGSVGSIP